MVALGYARGGVAGVSDWPQMYSAYPNPSCVRIFISTGSPLPAWSSSSWTVHPTSTVLVVSWKVWPFDLSGWLTDLPVARRNKVCLTYFHEPEQDMTSTAFKTNFDALLNSVDAHPNRQYVQIGPVYTAAWQYQNGSNWQPWWSTTMQAKCDYIGWDVYNRAGIVPSDYPPPMSPDHSDGITLKMIVASSQTVQKPYLIGEFGTRRTAADSTGDGAANWMRTWVEEMDSGPCSYATFWHDSGNDLLAENRTREVQELQALIAEFRTPGDAGNEPDPPDPPPTTAIEHVADAHAMNPSAATSLSVAAPAGLQAGDLLISWFGWLSTTVTPSSPAGFTNLADQADGTNLTARLSYRIAASEPATYAYGVSSAVKNAGWVGAYRGVHATAPIADWAVAPGDSGTAHVTPAVDVPAGGWIVYGVVTRHTGGIGVATWTSSGTAPNERYDAASNSGSADITMAVYDSGVFAAAATNVTRTVTSSLTEATLALFAVALAPGSPPAPGPGGGTTTAPTPGVPVA